MKRSGGSRPFRTLGSRMRAFGRSLMRHYVPPQDLPDFEDAPGWQSAAETPLLWPESPAPNDESAADEAEIFDAPDDNVLPAALRPRPAKPAPAVPPPAPAPVQRKPAASNRGVNPVLFDMLAKHDAREAERQRIRDEKKSAFDAAEIQRQADPDALPIRRRGRMAVDYVETGTLAQGDDAPPRPPKPSASEPPPTAIQRQPDADSDDAPDTFEDWNDDDGDDNDGTPPAVDPTPTPLMPPGIAQRFPVEDSTFVSDQGDNFEAESDADYPQNFADVSVPPSVVETRRPQQVVQRDFQPAAPDAVDDVDYYEADAPEDVADYGDETAALETSAQPLQRDYQSDSSNVPTQETFQQPDFDDAPLIDDGDGDTRPMPVQRAPVLPPPTFDDTNGEAAPADETGYNSLADWVDAHSDPATPTAPSSIQREIQPPESVDFEVNGDDGAGDGDTRPMPAQRAAQPLPSPFEDDHDFEPSFDAVDEVAYTAPAQSDPPPAHVVQRQIVPEADVGEFEVEADDSSEYPADNRLPEHQAAANVGHEETFTADTGDYEADDSDYPVPEYNDDDDENDYSDFDVPEQRRDETIYGDLSQAEISVQAVDTAPQPIQRQPEAGYDDHFALENTADYEAPAEYGSPDETAYDDFNPPEADTALQRQPEAAYDEPYVGEAEAYIAPIYSDAAEADTAPDFAPPSNTVQRQPEAAYDEAYAEDAGEAEEYAAPVYGGETEADANEYHAPPHTLQRQAELIYDEPYADDAGEFDVNNYAAPVDDNALYSAPTNTVQRQPAAPETAYDEPVYGDDDAAEYVDDTGDYTYHRHDEGSNAPDSTPPNNTIQRQPEAFYDEADAVDDDDDSSLYDSNYQAEHNEFVPAARHVDAPFSPPSDPVQRAEGMPSLETSSPPPPQFYGDDVYETDISALLNGQPDPRPVQRRAQLPDIAPQTADNMDDADEVDTNDASVDLYQAMIQTGMVEPDVSFDSRQPDTAPQSVQRAPDDQSASPPLDLFQAMMETGMVQAEHDDDAEPMSQATRMDLLSFLDANPPAPRADVNQTQAGENVSSQVYQPPQPTHVVQRVETEEQPEEAERPEKEADVDVDQLARDVYSVLRNRLRIERERRDHNP